MIAVKSTLRKGVANLNLEISPKFQFSDTLLHRLSAKFNTLASNEEEAIVINSGLKADSKKGHYIKWIYGAVANNDIKTYVELFVTFDVSKGITYPEVLTIDVRAPQALKLDKTKIIKEYHDRKAQAASLPPLPPPPGH